MTGNLELERKLVLDCITYRLPQAMSLEYIKQMKQIVTGNRRSRGISATKYKNIKKDLESDDALSKYLNEHSRIGFVKDQRDRAEEVSKGMEKIMNSLADIDPVKDRDDLVKIIPSLVMLSRRAEEISLSNPIISKIKMEADLARSGAKANSKKGGEGNRDLGQDKFK